MSGICEWPRGRLLISAHALRIVRVASAAREKVRMKVDTIYTLLLLLVTCSHWLLLLEFQIMSQVSLSIYVRMSSISAAMLSTSVCSIQNETQSIVHEYVVRSVFVDHYLRI